MEILLKRHEGLIWKVLLTCGLNLNEENVNSGRVGLWIGIMRFDLNRGTKLSTYVMYWIRAAVYRANYLLANERRIRDKCTSIYNVEGDLLPIAIELSDCSRSESELDEFLEAFCENERERKIIEMRMAGYTLQEIGNTIGVSSERVRQIIGNIVNKIKKDMGKGNFSGGI